MSDLRDREFAPDGRSNWERTLAGDWYQADDEHGRRNQAAQELAGQFNTLSQQGQAQQAAAILPQLIGELGQDVEIRPPLTVDYGAHLRIGDRTFINAGLVALDVAPITIGADCQLGPNVQLLTPIHPLEPGPRREKWEAARAITLQDNVWLGGGVVVCPGVTIGENSVIGAGSVVTRDIPANVLAVGNPARVIRELG